MNASASVVSALTAIPTPRGVSQDSGIWRIEGSSRRIEGLKAAILQSICEHASPLVHYDEAPPDESPIGAFEAAGMLRVVVILEDLLTFERTGELLEEKGPITMEERLDEMTKKAMREALRGAESPSRSTGQSHNLMALYTTAAWSKMAAVLEGRSWGW